MQVNDVWADRIQDIPKNGFYSSVQEVEFAMIGRWDFDRDDWKSLLVVANDVVSPKARILRGRKYCDVCIVSRVQTGCHFFSYDGAPAETVRAEIDIRH